MMLLNKDTDRKFELGGGFTTDPKYFQDEDEFIISSYFRWLSETWPLGVEYTKHKKAGGDLIIFSILIWSWPSIQITFGDYSSSMEKQSASQGGAGGN